MKSPNFKRRRIYNRITGKRSDVEQSGLAYWGKIGGHRLYYWPNIEFMFGWRLASLNLSYDRLGLGLTDSTLQTFLDKLEELYNEGNHSQVGMLIGWMQEYKNGWGQYDALLHLASNGVLVDGEPAGEFSKEHATIKEDLLREHEDVRAFFLNTAGHYLRSLNPESNVSEIKDFWNSAQGQRMASTLWLTTRMLRFKNLLSAGTPNSSGWQSEVIRIARMIYYKKPLLSTTKS
ncbi:MAG: hypothetical protein ACWA44_02360 [Thiotrichales bacterium]